MTGCCLVDGENGERQSLSSWDELDSGVSGRMDKQHAIRKQELTVRKRLE